jgi:glutathione synthase/RimK-type ligase-like ATP-grasp enzyme
MNYDLAILYEHPFWHQPLFDELDKLGVSYLKIDLTNDALSLLDIPTANVYYNMVSPSAYKRDNQKAIPFSRAICNALEKNKKKVLNGSASNELEFSKSNQIALLNSIDAQSPNTIIFNTISSLSMIKEIQYPMILKPEQGGSGARIYLINSFEELENLLTTQPELWLPDNLLLLQEKLDYDEIFGIIRIEFIEDEMLYAMRIVSHGAYNLCPSIVCNPEDDSNSICEIPTLASKPEFYPYLEISDKEILEAKRVFKATNHSIGSVEYIIDKKGGQVFYDINANSNLRDSIGQAFGVKPFEKVAQYLQQFTIGNKKLYQN